MTIIILIHSFLAIFRFYYVKKNSFRDSMVKSFLVTFLIIIISTELLSVFNLIKYNVILVIWMISSLILIVDIVLNWQIIQTQIQNQIKEANSYRFSREGKLIRYILFITSLILLVTLVIALKAPPNNFDSMTYHMARVSNWIQNQNIRYYPTAIPRQNYSMPLAEFGILHLQILSRGDHLANLVQWFCFLISIVLVSMISRELNISKKGQWVSALVAATLPMVILQSTSTQNDLVVSAFCLSFAYFLIKLNRDMTRNSLWFCSLSMGFALATKGTSYVYCAAIGISIGIVTLLNKRWNQSWKYIRNYILIVALAILLNSGIYTRNIHLYKNPILTSNERTVSEEISLRVLFSNLVRNGGAHLATPIQASNQILNSGVRKLLGSEIDNPASTFNRSSYQIKFYISDDDSGNFLHFLLLSSSILVLPWLMRKYPGWSKGIYLSIILSILLYSLLLKWQPWGGRLQTPIFLLGSVLITYLIDNYLSQRRGPGVIMTLLFVACIPYLLLNPIRPVMPFWEDDTVFYNSPAKEFIYNKVTGFVKQYPTLEKKMASLASLFYEGRSVLFTQRKELYFLGDFSLHDGYRGATKMVRDLDPDEIGLLMDSNDWEYPIWVLIKQHASKKPQKIYHLEVEDISKELNDLHNPFPDIILVTKEETKERGELPGYELIYNSDPILVFAHEEFTN